MKQNSATRIKAVSLILAVVHGIAALLSIFRLPETIPTHFSMKVYWVCDDVGSRYTMVLPALLPILLAAALLCSDRFTKAENRKVTVIVVLIGEIYMVLLYWMLYPLMRTDVSLGDSIETPIFLWMMPLMISAMMVCIGNLMPIVQPNKTLGIRISWTLENETCWRLTHRFAGRLWVITGVVTSAAILLCAMLHVELLPWMYIVLGEIFAVDIIAPVIYAYLHREDA